MIGQALVDLRAALLHVGFFALFAPLFLGAICAVRGGWRLYENGFWGVAWIGGGLGLGLLSCALIAVGH